MDGAAEKYFKEVIKYDKRNTSADNNLGNLYLMLGEVSKAIRKYKKALEIEPDNKRIKANLNRALKE